LLAQLLKAIGRQAVLVDMNPHNCQTARNTGLPVLCGDALSVEVLEEAGALYAHTVLAATANQELNTLVGQTVEDNFRVERVITLDAESTEDRSLSAMPGSFPGLEEVNRLLRLGRGVIVEYVVPEANTSNTKITLGEIADGDGEFALVLIRGESIYVATGDLQLVPGDRVVCLRTEKGESPLEDRLEVKQTLPAKQIKQLGEAIPEAR